MVKTIFLFNDGTGQYLDSPNQSNVAKLFRALPGDQKQYSGRDFQKISVSDNYYAYYISGIGTDEKEVTDEDATFWTKLKFAFKHFSKNKLDQIHGRQIAEKIERNIKIIDDIWEEGDQVYLVGFSRGAASIRITASHLFKHTPHFKIDYMLVFDTVYSVIGEIQIRSEEPMRRFDDHEIGQFVTKCDHLIAGDETREKFSFTPINQRENVRQILFSGSHSDVGGGHQISSLSDIALEFSINELKSLGINLQNLNINPDVRGSIQQSKLTNSGQNHGARDLSKTKFLIHKAVFDRCNLGLPIPLSLSTLIKIETSGEQEFTVFSSEDCLISKL